MIVSVESILVGWFCPAAAILVVLQIGTMKNRPDKQDHNLQADKVIGHL